MDNNSKNSNESFEVYSEYNKILRSWLVGYGVGLPVFIVSIQNVLAITNKHYLKYVLISLVIGILSQIISTLINKICNWLVYRSYSDNTFPEKFPYKQGIAISKMFVIDVIFDFSSIISYVIASYFTYKLLA
jgi:hypothetical protein